MFPELGGNTAKLQKEIIEEKILTDTKNNDNYLEMANKIAPTIKTTKELKPGWVRLSWKDGKLHKYSRDKKIKISEVERKEQKQNRN